MPPHGMKTAHNFCRKSWRLCAFFHQRSCRFDYEAAAWPNGGIDCRYPSWETDDFTRNLLQNPRFTAARLQTSTPLTGHGRCSCMMSRFGKSQEVPAGDDSEWLILTCCSRRPRQTGSRVPTDCEPLSNPLGTGLSFLTSPTGSFKSANLSANVFTR